jgi:hypothetical protein
MARHRLDEMPFRVPVATPPDPLHQAAEHGPIVMKHKAAYAIPRRESGHSHIVATTLRSVVVKMLFMTE